VIVFGIDPGVLTTGYAVVSRGRVLEHATVTWEEFIAVYGKICSRYRPDRIVIEASEKNILWNKEGPKEALAKMAINVGMNRMLARVYVYLLNNTGTEVLQVSPSKGQSKWPEATWRSAFNYKGRLPSSHARDAAVIALLNGGDK